MNVSLNSDKAKKLEPVDGSPCLLNKSRKDVKEKNLIKEKTGKFLLYSQEAICRKLDLHMLDFATLKLLALPFF